MPIVTVAVADPAGIAAAALQAGRCGRCSCLGGGGPVAGQCSCGLRSGSDLAEPADARLRHAANVCLPTLRWIH